MIDDSICLIEGQLGVSITVNDFDLTKNCVSTLGQTGWADMSKIKTNIVCNGFSMRDVILDVLMEHEQMDWFHRCISNQDIENLADVIQEALKIKLGLIQGDL
jgi:hypothetical protein